MNEIKLLGIKISTISVEELLKFITDTILENEKATIANVNIHAMNLAYEIPWFSNFLNRSEIVFCDGYGVMLGARLKGMKIPHRFTPPDFIPNLCHICTQHNFTLYFLGAKNGVANKAAKILKQSFPNLRIVGTQHGFFNKAPGHTENTQIIREINMLKPNILIVGFGMPLQEKWLDENWKDIDANISITVGAAFDYLSGEIFRFPNWITDNGLEWFGRLIIEPRRLYKRYLVGNPLFFWRVLRYKQTYNKIL